jgi:hypothetical protein
MGFAAGTPAVRQQQNWDCSAASLAWLLDSLGRPTSEGDAIGLLGSNINPAVGLTDATGAPLAAVLQNQGFSATNAAVGYDDVLGMAQAGTPLAIGGINYNHWTGVRGADGDDLLLANPAPGWMGVGDRMSRGQFAGLGPFYAVWIPGISAASGAGGGLGFGTGSPGAPPGLGGITAWAAQNPWLVLAAGAAAVLLVASNPTPTWLVRIRRAFGLNPDFFTRGGEVHPIRDSPDYEPAVEEISAEVRHERAQAERYRGVRRERIGRLTGGVDRPPWAAGLTDQQLIRIAREHGVRATQEGWWERAHLHSGSGELRTLLREGGHRGERGRKGTSAAVAAAEGRHAFKRGRLTAAQRRTARGEHDLPF